eukprot:13948933-Ditylum_brightwellii.AAC.1
MGVKHPKNVYMMIEEKLGLEGESLTTYFGRQSGTVALADAGILILNLKQAAGGPHFWQWKIHGAQPYI